MRRLLAIAVLCAALPGVATAAAPKFASLDTAEYPTVRATVVTPKPVGSAPQLTENGQPVVGFRAVNLGREKSVMLLFDRSQSMIGQAIEDASAAARQFVGSKPARDRIALVAVGKKAVQLTDFATNPAETDAALRTIEVDKVRGTALYDGIIVSTQALAADLNPTRVLILLTDGQEVSSDASLEQAIAAARDAHVAVYAIGIESPSFRPAPLQRLAEKTGGRYVGASGTKDLKAIYAALAEELRRTWQLSYVTSARPGDRIAVEAAGAHAESIVPGARHRLEARSIEAAGRVLRDRPRRRRHDRRPPRPDLGPLPHARTGRLAPPPPDQPAPRRAGAQESPRSGRGAVRDRLEPDEGDGEGIRPPPCLARAPPAARAGRRPAEDRRARLRRRRRRPPRRDPVRSGRHVDADHLRRDDRRRRAADLHRLAQGEAPAHTRSTTSCPTSSSRSPRR